MEASPLILCQRESVSGKLQNSAECCEPLLVSLTRMLLPMNNNDRAEMEGVIPNKENTV